MQDDMPVFSTCSFWLLQLKLTGWYPIAGLLGTGSLRIGWLLEPRIECLERVSSFGRGIGKDL